MPTQFFADAVGLTWATPVGTRVLGVTALDSRARQCVPEGALILAKRFMSTFGDSPRGQAEEFHRLFTRQLHMSCNIRPDNVVAFNRASIDLARRFSD